MIGQRAQGREHEELFKVVRAVAGNDVDRDDLVQEILLQLWCSLPRFEGKAKVPRGFIALA